MEIRPIFAWYDLWIGFYWDKDCKTLYFLPLPCVGVKIQFEGPRKMKTEETMVVNGHTVEKGVRVKCVEDDGSASEGTVTSVSRGSGDPDKEPHPRFHVEWDCEPGAHDLYYLDDMQEFEFLS